MPLLLYLLVFVVVAAAIFAILLFVGIGLIKIAFVCLILAALALMTRLVHIHPRHPHM